MTVRFIIGVLLTAALLTVAARRAWLLVRITRTGKPVEPWRTENVGAAVKAEITEVLGQKRLLQWTVPGIAHVLAFWGFLLLVPTIIEGFGALFVRDFSIPIIGEQPWLGFLEDLAIVGTFLGVLIFAVIRYRHAPAREGRRSRFFGSHLGMAWVVLGMILGVLASLLLYRGAQINTGYFPFESGAFASEAAAAVLAPLGETANEVLEHAGVILAIGILLVFLVIVLYSKHLHIFASPINVFFARRPTGLGALLPVRVDGKDIDFTDEEVLESLDPDATFGVGVVEDYTWKTLLDLGSCTECGRCQSQCPAWNTDKPLSPKLFITDLRDHALAKAPYLLADSDEARAALAQSVHAEVERPLVGERTSGPKSGHGEEGEDHPTGGVIDPDVLWSCTTCGACVEQCPVDIEHVDHILDLRRYQVMVESAFPSEAEVMLRNLEHAGDPWGSGASSRMDWAAELPFEVPVVGAGDSDRLGQGDLADVEYLFWVGCAGALDDAAKSTTQAVAQLLHEAEVRYAVLGEGEACTGDPARRMGNEFVFQMLARQNIETLDAAGVVKIVATCAHCFNTLANEYGQLGGEYEVLHHTELLARLVADGRLTPVTPIEETITYHDPCYLGRHNRVFSPPRDILGALPGATVVEMPRTRERSFCCGAGGARMWMDENLGSRINVNRSAEALELKPDVVSAACPFCIVMLTDGVTALSQESDTGDGASPATSVSDVSELLLRAVTPAAAPTNDDSTEPAS